MRVFCDSSGNVNRATIAPEGSGEGPLLKEAEDDPKNLPAPGEADKLRVDIDPQVGNVSPDSFLPYVNSSPRNLRRTLPTCVSVQVSSEALGARLTGLASVNRGG